MSNPLAGLIGKAQKRSGQDNASIAELAKIAEAPTKSDSNLRKTARVAKLSVYVTAQFTYVSPSSFGRTVFFKQGSFNAKRLGMKIKDTGVVTREVTVNGKVKKIVVKEKTVQTKRIKVSLGRTPQKRKTPTKGGRAIRGGGRTVGGGISAFAKDWVTINVPKGATTLDIVAYVQSFSKPVYEVAWDGGSIALLPYKTGLGNNK